MEMLPVATSQVLAVIFTILETYADGQEGSSFKAANWKQMGSHAAGLWYKWLKGNQTRSQ